MNIIILEKMNQMTLKNNIMEKENLKKQRNFRIEDFYWQEFKRVTKKNKLKTSEAIRQLIKEYLAR